MNFKTIKGALDRALAVIFSPLMAWHLKIAGQTDLKAPYFFAKANARKQNNLNLYQIYFISKCTSKLNSRIEKKLVFEMIGTIKNKVGS